MEFTDILTALRKRWWVVVVLTLLGAGYGYYSVASQTPMYRSTSKVFVSLTRSDTAAELVQGSTFAQNLVASYAQLATMPVVLDPVIEDLDLEVTSKSLASAVQADSPINTQIIEISATSSDPARAARIANAVSDELSDAVRKVSPSTGSGAPTVQITQVSPAVAPLAPFAPNKKLGLGGPAAAGFALGLLIAVAVSRLDKRIRSADDIPGHESRPVLGSVAWQRAIRDEGPAALLASLHGALGESYRRLRTNLQFVGAAGEVRTVVVTSSLPGEGKSTTAINLAITMAENKKRVLLIDADLRRPSVADRCGLEPAVGLSTLLVGDVSIEDVAQPWGVPDLDVIVAGRVPPNPSQLIDSDAMNHLLVAAREAYDLVIVDSPPLLALSDAAVLARHTDGAIVVVGCRKVRKDEFEAAIASLEAINAPCLGIVANGARDRRPDPLYGYGHETARRSRRRRLRRGRGTSQPAGPVLSSTPVFPARHAAGAGAPAPAEADRLAERPVAPSSTPTADVAPTTDADRAASAAPGTTPRGSEPPEVAHHEPQTGAGATVAVPTPVGPVRAESPAHAHGTGEPSDAADAMPAAGPRSGLTPLLRRDGDG